MNEPKKPGGILAFKALVLTPLYKSNALVLEDLSPGKKMIFAH